MKKALVLSLVMVLGLGVASFAQTLSGSWDTTITIDPTPGLIAIEISSELIVTYEVSGWSFTSDTTITDLGWQGQTFVVGGSLGAFTLGSTLTFDPAAPLPADFFSSWVVTGSLSLAGVSFDATFASALHDVMLELKASGSAGLVDVGAVVTFGSLYIDANGDWATYDLGTPPTCDFDWYGVDITVDFPFSCAVVASTISFDCAGFEYVKFEIVGIAVPTLPWLTLDATLMFETQTKTLVLTPVIDFGPTLCFDLYLNMDGLASVFPGFTGYTNGLIYIQGIGIEVEFGGVVFTGISFWDTSAIATGDKPGLLADTIYWEAYQIATTDEGCCGPFAFDVTLYFLDTSPQLFTVSKVVANMSIQVATQFTFSTGISVDLDNLLGVFTEWTIGFLVEW